MREAMAGKGVFLKELLLPRMKWHTKKDLYLCKWNLNLLLQLIGKRFESENWPYKVQRRITDVCYVGNCVEVTQIQRFIHRCLQGNSFHASTSQSIKQDHYSAVCQISLLWFCPAVGGSQHPKLEPFFSQGELKLSSLSHATKLKSFTLSLSWITHDFAGYWASSIPIQALSNLKLLTKPSSWIWLRSRIDRKLQR